MNETTLQKVGKSYRFESDLPLFGDHDGLQMVKHQKSSEYVAERIRQRLGRVKILELCAGVGGLSIFLAKVHPVVYAVEEQLHRILFIRKNARMFEVAKNIVTIQKDALSNDVFHEAKLEGVQAITIDAEFRDDPSKEFTDTTNDITKTMPSVPKLVKKARKITKNIVIHLPKTIDRQQVKDILGKHDLYEYKQKGTVRHLIAFFGDLA